MKNFLNDRLIAHRGVYYNCRENTISAFKEAIKRNYIIELDVRLTKDKKVIVVDKLGLPVNEYLKYNTQKFVSDKDENGDAISGSKKEKVYEYLNNIPD